MVHLRAIGWRAVGLALLLLVLAAGAAKADPVVVSLTFDDAVADQWTAQSLLKAHGMHGTFYVNTSRPGKSRFLTYDQIHQLAADGNEIGGHTIDHVNLPALGPDDQKREICDDRADLLAHGFAVTDFAYPFGSHNAEVEQVVQSCGYNSARITSGITSPRGCSGCPSVESFAPPDIFATRTPDSVKGDTPLSDLTGYVDAAIAHGGGWLTIVIHHVCVSCNPDAITPDNLNAFLDYLASKAPQGVVVETVHQVIGGPVQPAVHGPVLPQDGAPTNLLRNHSLETSTYDDGQAECWKQGGAGISQATWTRTTDAFDGTAAEAVKITALNAKSDRKLVSKQDTGTCAPKPSSGHRYRFAWWYKATAQVRPVAYIRVASGGWKFWAQGPPVKKSMGWAQSLWTTPRVPKGAIGISVGVSLRQKATMTVDNLLLQDTRTALPAPARVVVTDNDSPSTSTDPIDVAAGRIPVLVYRSLPTNLLAAQRDLERHLSVLRRAGFHPVDGAALSRVLAGRSAGVSKPVVLAFRGSTVDTIGMADGLLQRDGARALVVAPAASVIKPASLRAIAVPARWSIVRPGSRAGRAIRGRLSIRTRALRVPMSFATGNGTLVRHLRAASTRSAA